MLGVASLYQTYLVWGILIGVSGSIIYSDIAHRRIDNFLVVIVAVSAIIIPGFTLTAILPLILAVIVGLALFALGIFAGGDIKLMLAFLMGIAFEWWLLVLLLTAFIGGVMALAYLVYGFFFSDLNKICNRGLPYGVPITISGLFGLWLTIA